MRTVAVGWFALCVVLSALVACAGDGAVEAEGSHDKPFDMASTVTYLPPPSDVELLFPDAKDNSRIFHIDFVTRNVRKGQKIGIFIKTADGHYWPVPEENLKPAEIPINQRTSASVEVVGMPRGQPFSICLYALKKRGQQILREWFTKDGEKEPLTSVRYAIELGTIKVQ